MLIFCGTMALVVSVTAWQLPYAFHGRDGPNRSQQRLAKLAPRSSGALFNQGSFTKKKQNNTTCPRFSLKKQSFQFTSPRNRMAGIWHQSMSTIFSRRGILGQHYFHHSGQCCRWHGRILGTIRAAMLWEQEDRYTRLRSMRGYTRENSGTGATG